VTRAILPSRDYGISLTNIAVTSLTATNTTGAVSIGDAGGLTLTAVSVGGRVAITTSGNSS